jgi:stress response protein YsnF
MGDPEPELDEHIGDVNDDLEALLDGYQTVEDVYRAATMSTDVHFEAPNTASMPMAVLRTSNGVR